MKTTAHLCACIAALILLNTTSDAQAGDFLDDQTRSLTNEIDRYERIVKDGGWPSLHGSKKLEPGVTHGDVAIIREILTLTGDMDAGSAEPIGRNAMRHKSNLRTAGDVLDDNFANKEFYDSKLEDGIKQFQARHGLTPDGVVGPATRKAMSVPAVERLAQLLLTKERLSSFRLENPTLDEAVIVNLPGYTLYGLSDGKPEQQMRVIVGSKQNRTPLFSNQIAYVELNPQWYVPRSIASKEMLPKIKNDPSYLSRAGFKLSQGGQTLDATEVDWENVDQSNFDFRLTQRSGSGNALGKVKFMIPNNKSIYLHDTSKPHLFSRDYRALSHGCIRLEDPKAMAKFIMKHSNGTPSDEVAVMYDSHGQKRVTLDKPMDVHAVYWTAWVEPGKTQPSFYDDMYNRDRNEIAQKKRELEGSVEMAAND